MARPWVSTAAISWDTSAYKQMKEKKDAKKKREGEGREG
jgi:hypothetical protein